MHALLPKNFSLTPANVPKSIHNFGLNFSEYAKESANINLPSASVFFISTVFLLKEVIISHYDPLSLIDLKNLDPIRRRELFKRISAIENIENIPSYLDNKELEYLQSFLKTLTF